LFRQLGDDAPRGIPSRREAGALLSWLLLGNDDGDVRSRGDEYCLDGWSCRGDDSRKAADGTTLRAGRGCGPGHDWIVCRRVGIGRAVALGQEQETGVRLCVKVGV